MARKYTHWTEEMDSLLRKFYAEQGAKHVSNMLNITVKAVQMRAHKLRVSHKKRWTEEENKILEKNYNKGIPVPELCKLLQGKTRTKIEAAIRNRDLYRTKRSIITKEWTIRDLNFLKRNYLKMTYNQIATKLGRNRGSVAMKANKLGLYKRKERKTS